MSRETRINYEGGPLDGTELRKTAPARNPMYRSTEGLPIPAALGDRITGGRSATRSCYRLVSDHTGSDVRLVRYRITGPTPAEGA